MSVDSRRRGLDLRKQANEALQAKQGGKAVELFTLALMESSSVDRPEHMAALHCGRASAYVALCGYDFGAS